MSKKPKPVADMGDRKLILSRSELFKGTLVPEPRRCTVTLTTPEGDMAKCPNPKCGAMVRIDDCDVVGAEPNAVFCNECNQEMYLP